MAIYINRSEYGFNGALPGRTIETDDADYAKILLERDFEILETENNDYENPENPKSEKKKITKIVK